MKFGINIQKIRCRFSDTVPKIDFTSRCSSRRPPASIRVKWENHFLAVILVNENLLDFRDPCSVAISSSRSPAFSQLIKKSFWSSLIVIDKFELENVIFTIFKNFSWKLGLSLQFHRIENNLIWRDFPGSQKIISKHQK